MCKLFRKLFNLDRVEVLEAEVARFKELWEVEAEKRSSEVGKLVEQNARLLKNEYKHRKTWKGLSKFQATKYYYVVTQGGYYSIRGSKLIEPYMSEVTRRAMRNGFVVATEEEAKDLQRAIQRLGW